MSRSRRRPPGGPLPSLAPAQVTMVTQWPPYTLTSCQTGLGSTGSYQDTDLKLYLFRPENLNLSQDEVSPGK